MTTIKQIKAEAQAQIKAIREARDAAIAELRQAKQEKREPVLPQTSTTETYEQRAERVLVEFKDLVIEATNREHQQEKVIIVEAFNHNQDIAALVDECIASGRCFDESIYAYCEENNIVITDEIESAIWRVECLDIFEDEYHQDLNYRIHNSSAEHIIDGIEYEPMSERVSRYHEAFMDAFWAEQEARQMEHLANE